jgi:hypothetical protein
VSVVEDAGSDVPSPKIGSASLDQPTPPIRSQLTAAPVKTTGTN